MNISRAITHLKTQLGLNHITMPFKDPVTERPKPAEQIIQEILTNVTIPIFSQYQPWIREGNANLDTLKLYDQRNAIYMLPAALTTTPVMYVSNVFMPLHNNRGTYGDIAPAYGINRSVQGVMTSMAYMMVAGQMRAEPTWDYLGENKIKLYGFPRTTVTFRIACEHLANGETIPAGNYESFMQLAMLDMKMFLYNNLKLFDGIQSAHGTINLKIEEHQGADSERTAMLERWNDVFHLDMDWEQFM